MGFFYEVVKTIVNNISDDRNGKSQVCKFMFSFTDQVHLMTIHTFMSLNSPQLYVDLEASHVCQYVWNSVVAYDDETLLLYHSFDHFQLKQCKA